MVIIPNQIKKNNKNTTIAENSSIPVSRDQTSSSLEHN
jgi:hypothetical protein